MPEPHTPTSAPPARRELGLRLAAPSFVRPAGVAENCAFLEGLVDEAGLALFETEACLAYDEHDLPASLAALDLDYHVHLPLDLDWTDPDRAFAAMARLVEMTAYLSPRCFVLHPDARAEPGEVARRFAALGVAPERVLLENTHERSLVEDWEGIVRHGLGACLDIGHVLAYSQRAVLELDGLWERVRMVHAYAPHPHRPSRHTGLDRLDAQGRRLLDEVLERVDPRTTLMVEVFDEPGLLDSLGWLVNRAAGERT